MSGSVRTYNELPDSVLDFLNSFEGIKYVDSLVKKYSAKGESAANILHLVDSAALGAVLPSELPKKLESYLGVDATAAGAAAIDLVIHRLLPIADLIGLNAVGQLKAWGADPKSYENVERVQAGPASEDDDDDQPSVEGTDGEPNGAADETGPRFSDPILQHRLELIVGSYQTGVRTKEQAVAVLMRPVKTGGLEMGQKEAETVLELSPAKPAEVEATSEPEHSEPADVMPMPSIEPSSASPTRESVGAKGDDTLTEQDEAEVQQIVETKKAAMETPSLVTDTKAAAEKIAMEAKLTFQSGELKTRFEHIIDARLRDVRDGFQTRAKLEAAPDQGGVGLAGTQLVAVMEAVERMDAMHHEALNRQMAEKKETMRAEKAARDERTQEVQAREEQVMAKRYAELTGKAPTETIAPAPTRTTVAVPAAESVAWREQNIDTTKVKAAIEAAKASVPPIVPVMSEPSIPTAPSGRPKVEDIRFERKLAGPIEELRLLNLEDFRRYSKDPKQAVLKIRDKVDLVSQEGYDQRIAAIKAWRASPLSQLYVSISRDALLSGKGIKQLLEERRSAGEEVLTDEELALIVELNGILRF